jgi:RecA-family ATPase
MNTAERKDYLQRIRDEVPLQQLRTWRVWLLWKMSNDGEERKVPYCADGKPRGARWGERNGKRWGDDPSGRWDKDPAGQSDSPEDRARMVTFEEATQAFLEDNYTGLGVVLGPIPGTDKTLSGIDLDHVKNNGAWDPRAEAILESANSYAETSPRGEGLHILGVNDIGTLDEKPEPGKPSAEIYSGKRYFTVTGRALNTAELGDLTEVANETRRLFAKNKGNGAAHAEKAPLTTEGGDPVVECLKKRDMWLREKAPGVHLLKQCPWKHLHSSGSSETEVAYLEANATQRPLFKCHHSHCRHRGLLDLLDFIGLEGEDKHEPQIEILPLPTEWRSQRPPPQKFVIPEMLPEETVGMNVAASGTGKTSMMLKVAVCTAIGQALFGREIVSGGVVYVSAEDRMPSLRRRFQLLLDRLVAKWQTDNYSLSMIESAKDMLWKNLHFHAVAGEQLHLVRMDQGVVTQTGLNMKLIAAIPENTRLLVLDPFARFHGCEENSNAVGTAMINACEKITDEVGCSIIANHHISKSAVASGEMSHYAARGASAFVDAARVVWLLRGVESEEVQKLTNCSTEDAEGGDLVQWEVVKANDFKKPPLMWLKREVFDFERWEPEVGGVAVDVQRRLVELHTWWAGSENKRQSFTRKEVKDMHKVIFTARKATAAEIDSVITYGFHRGDLVAGEMRKHAHTASITFREGYEPNPM